MTEPSNFTWGYAVWAVLFVFVIVPAVLLLLRWIQVTVTRALRRHEDRAALYPLPPSRERSRP